jgi:hypothetical protein
LNKQRFAGGNITWPDLNSAIYAAESGICSKQESEEISRGRNAGLCEQSKQKGGKNELS